MQSDGHLLLVLHAPPRTAERHRVGRFFWRSEDGSWLSNGLGSGVDALNMHLDDYKAAITAIDHQEELSQTAEAYFDVLVRLPPIRRAIRNHWAAMASCR